MAQTTTLSRTAITWGGLEISLFRSRRTDFLHVFLSRGFRCRRSSIASVSTAGSLLRGQLLLIFCLAGDFLFARLLRRALPPLLVSPALGLKFSAG